MLACMLKELTHTHARAHTQTKGDALQICEVPSDEIHNVGQFLCTLLFVLGNAVLEQGIRNTCTHQAHKPNGGARYYQKCGCSK